MPPKITADSAAPPQRGQFLSLLTKSLEGDTFVKLVLAKYRGAEPELERVVARKVTVKGKDVMSLVYSYKTRDVTKNVSIAEALPAIAEVLGTEFENAHLLTTTREIQLAVSRKGKVSLRSGRAGLAPDSGRHDRAKERFLDLDRPFLAALGITDAEHRLVPSMARKWKQVNKFLEVLDHAFETSPLKESNKVRVVDFGAGKGYLTFAVHDYLTNTRKLEASVTGVELRRELVDFCNDAASKAGLEGLAFEQGDISSHAREPVDIMIALHACDTATDHAIHAGLQAGAAILLCAPCCHKELRPQMKSPAALRPLLRHGIHLGQEAEMVTDGLRALLLESRGYEAKIFEFVSLEHTSKNKMILAIRRDPPAPRAEVDEQVRDLMAYYGIREQSLDKLLRAGP
jgi:hypothetical protein